MPILTRASTRHCADPRTARRQRPEVEEDEHGQDGAFLERITVEKECGDSVEGLTRLFDGCVRPDALLNVRAAAMTTLRKLRVSEPTVRDPGVSSLYVRLGRLGRYELSSNPRKRIC